MELAIQEYAKRLKLSWIRQHYQDVQSTSNEEYLLILLELEVQQREERRVNLLLSQAALPKISSIPFQWDEIEYNKGLTKNYLLEGQFIKNQENLIFYGGIGTGKTFLSTLIGLKCHTEKW
ncbi:ATP-binding protein [Neobacillus drentensis]|uniref:ATP-binding protein n=1 Tax=Neobacillus drentensis TaxID=220684 RepID=UPI003B5873B1